MPQLDPDRKPAKKKAGVKIGTAIKITKDKKGRTRTRVRGGGRGPLRPY